MSEQQQSRLAIDGYLVLPGMLSKAKLKRIVREVDRLHRKYRSPDAKPRSGLDRRDILADSPVFIDLIDYPKVFDIIVDLMGSYIQLSMAEATVRAPNPEYKGFIHTDGGQALRRIRVTETSWPLQLKIQYFLTDVSQPYRGNFTVFPGSHLRPFPEGDVPVTVETPGAVQLCVKAGDAAIFSHSLWHGLAPNLSGRARKSLIYCYSQMCFRPFDFNGHSPHALEQCTARQPRLFGDLGREWRPGAYFYSPEDQEVVIVGK